MKEVSSASTALKYLGIGFDDLLELGAEGRVQLCLKLSNTYQLIAVTAAKDNSDILNRTIWKDLKPGEQTAAIMKLNTVMMLFPHVFDYQLPVKARYLSLTTEDCANARIDDDYSQDNFYEAFDLVGGEVKQVFPRMPFRYVKDRSLGELISGILVPYNESGFIVSAKLPQALFAFLPFCYKTFEVSSHSLGALSGIPVNLKTVVVLGGDSLESLQRVERSSGIPKQLPESYSGMSLHLQVMRTAYDKLWLSSSPKSKFHSEVEVIRFLKKEYETLYTGKGPKQLSDKLADAAESVIRPDYANAKLSPSQTGSMPNQMSERFALLLQVAEKVWSEVLINEKEEHPTNEDVVNELMVVDNVQNYLGFENAEASPFKVKGGVTLAKKCASLVRPHWAAKGRKKGDLKII